MAAKQKIKGDDLMMFDNAGKSIAFATSHTLTISADTADTSTKDHGVWGSTEVNKLSWELSSDNLYVVDEFDKLVEAMMSRQPVKIYFGLKKENDPTKTVADGDYENWTVASGAYSGDAIITSINANANTGENATYSVSYKGVGKLVKVTTVPTAG